MIRLGGLSHGVFCLGRCDVYMGNGITACIGKGYYRWHWEGSQGHCGRLVHGLDTHFSSSSFSLHSKRWCFKIHIYRKKSSSSSSILDFENGRDGFHILFPFLHVMALAVSLFLFFLSIPSE